MTLDTYRKAHNLTDLGSLTEPCEQCKQATKLRDFVWTGGSVVCRKCALPPPQQNASAKQEGE